MGWNSSEGILDERVSSIEKLGTITNVHVTPLRNGKYVLKFLGNGNAFSGFPYVMGTQEYNSKDEAIQARLDYLQERSKEKMKDYDIFFKGTYFGTAKNMPANAEVALEAILADVNELDFYVRDNDNFHIEEVVFMLDDCQTAFMKAYSRHVAKVDDEEIIEYFRTGKRTYNTDHIEDSWHLWLNAIEWGRCNEEI